jgi:hypothetical protein
MTGNIIESGNAQMEKMKRKELEFQLAKSKLERKNKYHGENKRKLNSLNNYYDYSPGMFDHVK